MFKKELFEVLRKARNTGFKMLHCVYWVGVPEEGIHFSLYKPHFLNDGTWNKVQ
jgi:hypothetical protein